MNTRKRVPPPQETPEPAVLRKRPVKAASSSDLGFSTKVTEGVNRMLNRDGTFNVKRTGLPLIQSSNMYHRLITMSWWNFNVMVIFSYLIVNLSFASIYYSIGMHHLAGASEGSNKDKFIDAFFFSAQTLTTVGYGRISPLGFWASMVAAVESLAGLLGFALATGLLYGRFSRPVARILSSKMGVIAPYKNQNAFMFRIANERANQLIDVDIQITFSRVEADKDHVKSRRFYTLKLERRTINFLASSWTVVHPIDEESPLFHIDKHELAASDAEFIVLIKAFDDTFSQTVHSRLSYKPHEIEWGAKFKPMFDSDRRGHTILYLNKISDYETVSLN